MRAINFLRTPVFLFLIAFLGYLPTVSGQTTPTYGNEWINYGQTYYKVKVLKTGMHRLTFADLSAAGISGVDPEKFQLFRRGQELAIYVNGQADHVFNAGDYIEFYGEKNDGKLDAVTYKSPADQVHQYYALHSDTAAYFLTFGTQNGKRMQVKTSVSSGLTPEARHYTEAMRLKVNSYSPGERGSRSWNNLSEGFTSSAFGTSRRDTIAGLTNLDNTGRAPVLEAAVQGAYFAGHQVKFMVTPATGPRRVLTNAATGPTGVLIFPVQQYRKPRFDLQYSDITAAGRLTVRAHVHDSLIGDNVRMNYYRLTYARTNNLGAKNSLILTDSQRTTPSYFLFSNPPANAVAYDVTDPANVIRTEAIASGTQRGFVFDPSPKSRRILVVNGQAPEIPTGIRRIRFRPITATAFNYIIVTHPSLHQPVAGTPYTDPPRDYAAYRASPAGGGYLPLVLDIDSVYNQFHYGERSPQAITNLMNWFMANGQPKFLFLMGKGYVVGQTNPNVRANAANLVPTAGSPASDVLFTADWKNNNYAPRVPTGRLAAQTSAQIINYLEKVKVHEALGVEEWRKNFLHLGGGKTGGEIATFSNYLRNYENKAEGPLLGANVKTVIRPNTGGLIKLNVKDEVNAGLSLITFFGHSSGTVSDIDIGFVSDPINGFNNTGKYPMILMNGCLAGNAFQGLDGGRFSFGEDWILTPQKGAILFIGSVGDAFAHALNNYSNSFYTTAFTDSAYYGAPIGNIQRRTIERSATMALPTDLNNVQTLTQMILQGDPAVRLFAPEKPDYFVKAGGLNLTSDPAGAAVNTDTERLDLVIDVKNTGKAIDSMLVVSVKRFLPNGDSILYPSQTFPPVYNQASLHFKIDNRNVSSFGNNTFVVTLDYGNRLDELNEGNNTARLDRFFTGTGVLTLLPEEFSIVSSPTVTMVGQPANLAAAVARDYYFELDTIPDFSSGFKRSAVIQNATTAPAWTTTLAPGTAPNDSVVYYWRMRFNTFSAQEDTVWAGSSFRFIPGSAPGWSQSHYGQFAKDNTTNITMNQATRQWEFAPINREVQLSTVGGAVAFTVPGPHGILLDQTAYFDNGCAGTGPRIMAVVLHPTTLQPYTGYPLGRCGKGSTDLFYSFGVSTNAQINAFGNFMRGIPTGYYVALITENSVPFTTFTAGQRTFLKLIGSQMIDTLKTGYPFAIVGRKGVGTTGVGTLIQEKTYDPALGTAANTQVIDFTLNLVGREQEGTIVSTKIGPATAWTSLHHNVKKSAGDQYTLSLYGFTQNGTRAQLNPNIQSSNFSLSGVDATQYPFLQLEMHKKDTLNATPPQLKQWMVVYAGVPEGILRRDLASGFSEDINVQASKGNVKLRFVFTNISDFDFADSLTVVRIVSGTKPLQDTIKLKRLVAHDSVFFEYSFSTAGMKGNNTVRVEVNPQLLPELHYFNNFIELPFNLSNTDLHPVLDVAFDGVHIMDGDIVSPSPHIAINLKDEDKFDFVQDPEKLEIFLLRPGAMNFEKVNVTDATLVTLPNLTDPARDKRDFTITYNPKNLPDGIYKLRVQGRDNSDNEAGFEPYTISFEVINASSISNFYPYPNPFSSNTRFVFTLTGHAENMPRNLKIQVMTLTGKVVREIQKEELGLIRVGNNISLPWDGTDEYGDKLANGAYLYRVVMEKAPLEEMKHRNTAGDKSFKKEYGKLYILR